ncbi:aminoglycoside phosphotransferase family protein [Phaeobacter gallaeciensis]|uniref:aminoglycoside phosphotransferase family protein n=1 Tax=Phaeobacter gallaeciensis TaxID=60890 RepID=UPI0023802061|nr:aminoglycoside phosphotransferase family protein [Phaeobacter gallaeciensis]MDE4275136.1 aminoglycoside phosphotransferase family protein [Phaeobacter gallaeciensis]MDE4300547.1 aminoglycoside phosphotransferase family protein [Phaeobacter gallaeciensis]MDE5185711.1 aminoglycoside phosphotransferase family protein [Phaeobacter gallaeciensis]
MSKDTDDIAISDAMVGDILATEVPQWAGLPRRRIESSGTDNCMVRIGEQMVLRVPRRWSATQYLAKELDWLPRLQGLPLAVPVLRYRGCLQDDLPFGIFDWMAGRIATPAKIADPVAAAQSLAEFLMALHLRDTEGAPVAGESNNRRGVALQDLAHVVHPAIDILKDEIDAPRARCLWDVACAAGVQDRPVWLHGDLKADNLIALDGTLRGVIDWGLSAVGDPGVDYAAAWTWVDPAARTAFRDRLELQDRAWVRASGWALYCAVIALSFYRGGKNEALCRQSRLTLSRLDLLR